MDLQIEADGKNLRQIRYSLNIIIIFQQIKN